MFLLLLLFLFCFYKLDFRIHFVQVELFQIISVCTCCVERQFSILIIPWILTRAKNLNFQTSLGAFMIMKCASWADNDLKGPDFPILCNAVKFWFNDLVRENSHYPVTDYYLLPLQSIVYQFSGIAHWSNTNVFLCQLQYFWWNAFFTSLWPNYFKQVKWYTTI